MHGRFDQCVVLQQFLVFLRIGDGDTAVQHVVGHLRLDEMMLLQVEAAEKGSEIPHLVIVLDVAQFVSSHSKVVDEKHG